MKIFLILFIATSLFTVNQAFALLADGTPKITWQFPTANTDESPLALTDLKETILSCSPNPDMPIPVNLPKNVTKVITVPANFWQAIDQEFDSGEYRCTAVVVNTDGIVSGASDPLSFLVPYKTPKNPVLIGVE